MGKSDITRPEDIILDEDNQIVDTTDVPVLEGENPPETEPSHIPVFTSSAPSPVDPVLASTKAGDISRYTPYLGTGIAFGNENMDYQRADRQSAAAKWGNAFGRMLFGEAVAGTIQSIGALGEPEIIISALKGEEVEFSNAISRYGDELRASVDKAFPIYRRNPGRAWDYTNAGWWAENSVSVASTLSMLIPAYGAFGMARLGLKGIGKLGKFVKISTKLGRFLETDLGNSALRLLTMPTAMRHSENFREASQLQVQTESRMQKQLRDMSDERFAEYREEILKRDPEADVSSKDAFAKYVGGKAAMKSYQVNAANLAFDIVQIAPLLKGFGVAGFASRNAAGPLINSIGDTWNVSRKMAKQMFTDAGKTWTKAAAVKHALLRGGVHTVLASTEGMEEFVNYVGQEEGNRLANVIALGAEADNTFLERISHEYLNDPHAWEQAAWGMVGGMVFQGAQNAIVAANKSIAKYRTGGTDDTGSTLAQGQANMFKTSAHHMAQYRMEVAKIDNVTGKESKAEVDKMDDVQRHIYNVMSSNSDPIHGEAIKEYFRKIAEANYGYSMGYRASGLQMHDVGVEMMRNAKRRINDPDSFKTEEELDAEVDKESKTTPEEEKSVESVEKEISDESFNNIMKAYKKGGKDNVRHMNKGMNFKGTPEARALHNNAIRILQSHLASNEIVKQAITDAFSDATLWIEDVSDAMDELRLTKLEELRKKDAEAEKTNKKHKSLADEFEKTYLTASEALEKSTIDSKIKYIEEQLFSNKSKKRGEHLKQLLKELNNRKKELANKKTDYEAGISVAGELRKLLDVTEFKIKDLKHSLQYNNRQEAVDKQQENLNHMHAAIKKAIPLKTNELYDKYTSKNAITHLSKFEDVLDYLLADLEKYPTDSKERDDITKGLEKLFNADKAKANREMVGFESKKEYIADLTNQIEELLKDEDILAYGNNAYTSDFGKAKKDSIKGETDKIRKEGKKKATDLKDIHTRVQAKRKRLIELKEKLQNELDTLGDVGRSSDEKHNAITTMMNLDVSLNSIDIVNEFMEYSFKAEVLATNLNVRRPGKRPGVKKSMSDKEMTLEEYYEHAKMIFDQLAQYIRMQGIRMASHRSLSIEDVRLFMPALYGIDVFADSEESIKDYIDIIVEYDKESKFAEDVATLESEHGMPFVDIPLKSKNSSEITDIMTNKSTRININGKALKSVSKGLSPATKGLLQLTDASYSEFLNLIEDLQLNGKVVGKLKDGDDSTVIFYFTPKNGKEVLLGSTYSSAQMEFEELLYSSLEMNSNLQIGLSSNPDFLSKSYAIVDRILNSDVTELTPEELIKIKAELAELIGIPDAEVVDFFNLLHLAPAHKSLSKNEKNLKWVKTYKSFLRVLSYAQKRSEWSNLTPEKIRHQAFTMKQKQVKDLAVVRSMVEAIKRVDIKEGVEFEIANMTSGMVAHNKDKNGKIIYSKLSDITTEGNGGTDAKGTTAEQRAGILNKLYINKNYTLSTELTSLGSGLVDDNLELSATPQHMYRIYYAATGLDGRQIPLQLNRNTYSDIYNVMSDASVSATIQKRFDTGFKLLYNLLISKETINEQKPDANIFKYFIPGKSGIQSDTQKIIIATRKIVNGESVIEKVVIDVADLIDEAESTEKDGLTPIKDSLKAALQETTINIDIQAGISSAAELNAIMEGALVGDFMLVETEHNGEKTRSNFVLATNEARSYNFSINVSGKLGDIIIPSSGLLELTNNNQVYANPETGMTFNRVSSVLNLLHPISIYNNDKASDRGTLIHSIAEAVFEGRITAATLSDLDDKTIENIIENQFNTGANKKKKGTAEYAQYMVNKSDYTHLAIKAARALIKLEPDITKRGPNQPHISTEVTVMGTIGGLNIAGSIDLVITNPNGHVTLIDFKTKGSNEAMNDYINSDVEDADSKLHSNFDQLRIYRELYAQTVNIGIESIDLAIVPIAALSEEKPTILKENDEKYKNFGVLKNNEDGSKADIGETIKAKLAQSPIIGAFLSHTTGANAAALLQIIASVVSPEDMANLKLKFVDSGASYYDENTKTIVLNSRAKALADIPIDSKVDHVSARGEYSNAVVFDMAHELLHMMDHVAPVKLHEMKGYVSLVKSLHVFEDDSNSESIQLFSFDDGVSNREFYNTFYHLLDAREGRAGEALKQYIDSIVEEDAKYQTFRNILTILYHDEGVNLTGKDINYSEVAAYALNNTRFATFLNNYTTLSEEQAVSQEILNESAFAKVLKYILKLAGNLAKLIRGLGQVTEGEANILSHISDTSALAEVAYYMSQPGETAAASNNSDVKGIHPATRKKDRSQGRNRVNGKRRSSFELNLVPTGIENQHMIEQMLDLGVIKIVDETTREETEDCAPGTVNIRAKEGLNLGFTPGGRWKIIKTFKGKSHAKGGIDIEVGNGKVKLSNKEGVVKAAQGLILQSVNQGLDDDTNKSKKQETTKEVNPLMKHITKKSFIDELDERNKELAKTSKEKREEEIARLNEIEYYNAVNLEKYKSEIKEGKSIKFKDRSYFGPNDAVSESMIKDLVETSDSMGVDPYETIILAGIENRYNPEMLDMGEKGLMRIENPTFDEQYPMTFDQFILNKGYHKDKKYVIKKNSGVSLDEKYYNDLSDSDYKKYKEKYLKYKETAKRNPDIPFSNTVGVIRDKGVIGYNPAEKKGNMMFHNPSLRYTKDRQERYDEIRAILDKEPDIQAAITKYRKPAKKEDVKTLDDVDATKEVKTVVKN